ncbi:MAG TPA: hypothetical protein VLV83_09290 [Acidobacteriota bacterium]|nr:hypothetical protein [Acidobacteriota bacterium]
MSAPRRIVLAGALAQKPGKAGHAWVFLQYLLGLRDLGYRPLLIDQIQEPLQDVQRHWFHEVLCHPVQPLEGILLDEMGHPVAFQRLRRATPAASTNRPAHDPGMGGQLTGGDSQGPIPSRADCRALIEDSLGLINVQGFLRDAELLQAARRRLFLDIDPGFTQMWQDLGLTDFLDVHDAYATVGGRIGQPDCPIPTCGKDWIHILPPVHLPSWPAGGLHDRSASQPEAGGQPPAEAPPGEGALTSVISWRGAYGPLEYKGRTYRLRVHEFRRFWDLPAMLRGEAEAAPRPTDSGAERNRDSEIASASSRGIAMQLAIDIDPADEEDRQSLISRGWDLLSADSVGGDLESYRDYLRRSLGEFLVAKNIYVDTRSGWFSDRSACYLASGRPVLAQDTGLGDLLPTNRGLLTFTSAHQAVRQIRLLLDQYPVHARAARRIAEDHLDAEKILPRLLHQAGVDA